MRILREVERSSLPQFRRVASAWLPRENAGEISGGIGGGNRLAGFAPLSLVWAGCEWGAARLRRSMTTLEMPTFPAVRDERIPMKTIRRFSAALALAAMALLMGVLLASCAKNELLGRGIGLWIGVRGVGPQGLGPDGTGCPVNSIDSIIFVQDVDSTTLAVTSFVLRDSLGNDFPGSVEFVASNKFVAYFRPFPSTAYYTVLGKGTASGTIGKAYFVPAHNLSGHKTYTYSLTTGVRMRSGKLERDVKSWSFTTGDSVAPPQASRPS